MPSRPLCPPGCDNPSHYSCQLRLNGGLQVSPRVQMTRTQNWKPSVSKPPAINAEILCETRPDGSKMPILTADGDVIRHREAVAKEAHIESTRRAIRNGSLTAS